MPYRIYEPLYSGSLDRASVLVGRASVPAILRPSWFVVGAVLPGQPAPTKKAFRELRLWESPSNLFAP